MGVWIETLIGGLFGKSNTSHPSWVCGLKQQNEWSLTKLMQVTPFVGVWIETDVFVCDGYRYCVTPFVGVWIETQFA